MSGKSIKAFTLIELLIVIAIIAILGSATVLVLNPVEMMSQARDSQRVNDLGVMKKAVDLAIFNNPSISAGTAQRIYLSLPSATAPSCDAVGLPTLPSGWQYVCSSSANLTKIDGSGWLPINFTSINNPTITSLPIDPVNSVSLGKYYTYVTGGSYELTAVMESSKENKAAISDGGSLTGVLQVGTHIDLTPPLRDKGLVGYWTFDEGSGTTVYDSSGNGNNGTLYNSPLWQSGSSCESGSCILFNGTNNYINVPSSSSLNPGMDLSLLSWVYWNGGTAEENIVTKENAYEYRVLSGVVNFATNPWSWRGGGTPVTTGQWYHVAVVHQGQGNQKIYINGIETYNAASGGSISSNTSVVTVGARGGGTQSFFNGLLDGVRIYNRALSAGEILTIYNSQK